MAKHRNTGLGDTQETTAAPNPSPTGTTGLTKRAAPPRTTHSTDTANQPARDSRRPHGDQRNRAPALAKGFARYPQKHTKRIRKAMRQGRHRVRKAIAKRSSFSAMLRREAGHRKWGKATRMGVANTAKNMWDSKAGKPRCLVRRRPTRTAARYKPTACIRGPKQLSRHRQPTTSGKSAPARDMIHIAPSCRRPCHRTAANHQTSRSTAPRTAGCAMWSRQTPPSSPPTKVMRVRLVTQRPKNSPPLAPALPICRRNIPPQHHRLMMRGIRERQPMIKLLHRVGTVGNRLEGC